MSVSPDFVFNAIHPFLDRRSSDGLKHKGVCPGHDGDATQKGVEARAERPAHEIGGMTSGEMARQLQGGTEGAVGLRPVNPPPDTRGTDHFSGSLAH